MKKRTGKPQKRLLAFAVMLLGILLCSGCLKEENLKEKAEMLLEHVPETVSSEPEEVQRLREQDVAASDGEHLEYYFRQLSQEEQRTYREILEGTKNWETDIYLSTADSDGIDRAYHAMMLDHPELFWIRNRELTYKTIYDTYTVFQPGYTGTPEEAQSVQAQMESAYQEVAQAASGQDVYNQARIVYEYVINHVEYQAGENDQSLAGAFGDGKAVCAGYAAAVQYLLERLGAECIYVSGDAEGTEEGHAWNIVNMDGMYYYVDATNGDQPEFMEGNAEQMSQETILYDYLCPFPWEYEVSYQNDGEFSVPSCTSVDENFYVRNGSCFTGYDWDQVYGFACSILDGGNSLIRFKYTDEEGYQQAKSALLDQGQVEEIAQYYMNINGLGQVQYYYGFMDNLKTIYLKF